MKKIAVIALALSLASTTAFAQTTPPVTPNGGEAAIVPGAAPGVVIAGGVGAGGIVLGALGLLALTGLGGSNRPVVPGTPVVPVIPDDNGSDTTTSSTTN